MSKLEGIKLLIKDYFENTTIHGISRAFFSEGKLKKFIWTFLCTIAFAFLSYQTASIVGEFLSYPTYVKIEKRHKRTIPFPSVTICDPSAHAYSDLTPENQAIIKLNITDIESKDAENIDFASLIFQRQILFEELKSKQRTSSVKGKRPVLLEKMRDSCIFALKPCCNFSDDFIEVTMINTIGKCVMFNPNGRYSQVGNGITFGLSLILFVNQSDRIPVINTEEGNGLLISIHGQNTHPFPSLDSLWVQAGTNTRVSLKKIITTRLKHPYTSNCSDGNEVLTVFPGVYTTHNCQVSCYWLEFYHRCGDIGPSLRRYMPESLNPKRNNHTKIQYALCSMKFHQDQINRGTNESCFCPLPCKGETFSATISASKWPSEADLHFYKIMFSKALGINSSHITNNFVRENFLRLNIFYDDVGYRILSEQIKYSVTELLSNIGGQLGLWMGLSAFSVVEIFALVFSISFALLFSTLRKASPEQSESNANMD